MAEYRVRRPEFGESTDSGQVVPIKEGISVPLPDEEIQQAWKKSLWSSIASRFQNGGREFTIVTPEDVAKRLTDKIFPKLESAELESAEVERLLKEKNFFDLPSSASKNVSEKAQPAMSDDNAVSRPELDAKLSAIEARLETQVTRIESKIDLVLKDNSELKSRFSSTKWEMIGIFVAGLIALLGVTQAMISSLDDSNRSWMQQLLQLLDAVK